MPADALLTGLLKEMRAAPYTVTVVLALAVATVTGWWVVIPRMAQASELKQATDQLSAQLAKTVTDVGTMRADMKLGRMQDRLKSLQQELFSVQREESRMRAANLQVPELYAVQIDKMSREIGTLNVEIQEYRRLHPELVEQ